jgi:diguanylate cyclase (GGDEF)-like protein
VKIGAKYLLIIALITILLGMTALSGVLLSTSLLEKEITGKYLAVSAYAMERVHRLFTRRYENMRMLANEPVLRSRDSTPARITDLLVAYKKNQSSSYAPYISISFFDLNRTRIADTEGQGIGLRHGMTECWQKIAKGDEYVLDISASETLGKKVFHLACLVRDVRGAPFGVVVSRISVDSLPAIVEGPLKLFKLGLMPNVDLIDKNGLILYSTHNKAGMLKDIWPAFGIVNKKIAAGEHNGTGVFRGISRQNTEEILIFAREERDANYQGNDWTLAISVPQQIALSSMIGLRNRLILIIVVIGCLCAGIATILSKTITRPLVLLSQAASEVGEGKLDIEVKVSSGDEVGRLSKTFNSMVKRLDELNRDLQLAASVDKLTGALNRRKIDEVMLSEMARAKRYHSPLSLIIFDLDHFKQVNDTYGHLAGDEVLKTVVAVTKQNIRLSDSLGRWGGEEFLLLLPQTDTAQAVEVAEKIRQSIEHRDFSPVGLVTISCGVAGMREIDSEDSLLKRADDALYAAKRRGRNLVEACKMA